jgi:hypothetical protein
VLVLSLLSLGGRRRLPLFLAGSGSAAGAATGSAGIGSGAGAAAGSSLSFISAWRAASLTCAIRAVRRACSCCSDIRAFSASFKASASFALSPIAKRTPPQNSNAEPRVLAACPPL